MKKTKKLYNPLRILCSFLILVAPLITTQSASVYFWGEPEVPDELKKLSS